MINLKENICDWYKNIYLANKEETLNMLIKIGILL